MLPKTAPWRGCIVGEKRGGAPCRVKIYRIKPKLRCANGSGKVIVDLHPAPDQHQNLTTSRGSLLAHAYHLWRTSVNTFVSYPVHGMTDRQTDSNDHKTLPWQSNKQVYRRRYEKCRSPKPKLHEKKTKNTFCAKRLTVPISKFCEKLLPHAKFHWNRAVGCWVTANI